VIELLNDNQQVVIVDNLVNASYEAIRRIEQITGKKVTFYKVDILDKKALLQVFHQHPDISSVIHFAGLKAVGESTQIPLDYYYNNITGTISLLQAMKEVGVKDIVFSSSATVYGDPPIIPIPETCPIVSTDLHLPQQTLISFFLIGLHQSLWPNQTICRKCDP
jgi:UDP-glucose 4-epimerase